MSDCYNANLVNASYTPGNRVSWTTLNAAVNGFYYDAAGNVINDGRNNYAYDAEGRLCAVQVLVGNTPVAQYQYLYNAAGVRVGKASFTGTFPAANTTCAAPGAAAGFQLTNQYLLDLSGDQVTELDGAGAWKHSNVWAGSHLTATYDLVTELVNNVSTQVPALHFHLADPLGTRRVQANYKGSIEETCQSLPFGDQLNCSLTAGLATADDATENHFTGKERDSESGLDYFPARYYGSSMGRWMSPDWAVKAEPVPYAKLDNPQTLNLYAYVGNNPLSRFDADGHCADHYKDGSCKVNVDADTGKAGARAGKQLEGILNKYDKAVNALDDKGKFNIRDSNGKITGSMTGQEIKAVWNGTSFTVTNQQFNNGGGGGGTGGSWSGNSFSGQSRLNPGVVADYGNAAGARNEPWRVGFTTLIFHELGHETHFGEALTRQYPVTPELSWPREHGASSAGSRMSQMIL